MTIKQKQWQLWYLGYYGGEIDGIWGSLSRDATVKFQQDNGLETDSIFGPLTEAKSVEIVKGIQDILEVPADGLAGEQTKQATIAYQKANGLDPDGIAGPLTRKALAQEDNWWESIEYFHRSEFKCQCGGKYCNGYPAEPKKALVQTADRVRKHFGAPALVSSGVRCPQHNTNVGGVSNSRHLYGKAMDFCVEGKTAQQVIGYVQSQPEIRYAYAIDGNYVHMDVK